LCAKLSILFEIHKFSEGFFVYEVKNSYITPMMDLIKSFADWREDLTDSIETAADWCNDICCRCAYAASVTNRKGE
jgi:hypothetical protein